MKRKWIALCGLFIICMTMLAGRVEAADPGEKPLAVVGAGSDFQYRTNTYDGVTYDTLHEANAALLERILSNMRTDHPALDEYFFLGDYDAQYYTAETSGAGLAIARQTLRKVYGDIPSLAVQGNHDPMDTPGLAITGSYDRTHYGVYLINEDDFSWCGGNPDQARTTAAKLKAYLDEKAAQGWSKPIFVLNHLPLHHSHRVGQGADIVDNRYARALVDVLNQAGEKGLRIIYLFGHNHSGTYDAYLGSDSICLTPGTSMPVTDPSLGTVRDYRNVTLQFTYMNAGYLGYVNGNCSSTVFEIYEDRVELFRYDETGRCNLKNPGVGQREDLGWQPVETPLDSPWSLVLSDLRLEEVSNPAAQRLDVGSDEKVAVRCEGAVRYLWKSMDPEVVQVSGSGAAAVVSGVAPGTAQIKVTAYGATGAPVVTYLDVTVVPPEAVEGDGCWLWTNGAGEWAEDAQLVSGASLTVMTDGVLSQLPVTCDMLDVEPLTGYIPGSYTCTVSYDGILVSDTFALTVPQPDEGRTDIRLLALGEERYYICGGVFDTRAEGLTKIEGRWYELQGGMVAKDTTGFVNFGTERYYVNFGEAQTQFTGPMEDQGQQYYLVKGRLAAKTGGLVKIQGTWYYLKSGRVATEVTTLVKYCGSWYYVQKGKLAHNVSTLVKYNGEWFYVKDGKVASQTTTLILYNGGWYYIYKGKVAAKTTTLVKYHGTWYYVREGKVDFSYNGPFRFCNHTYRVEAGKVVQGS